jgi:hypothetical protein
MTNAGMELCSWHGFFFIKDLALALHLLLIYPNFSFPGATNDTLLQKFNSVHKENDFYIIPQRKEAAFIIRHYAGKVKYQVLYWLLPISANVLPCVNYRYLKNLSLFIQIGDFREKNMDLMRHDIVSVLKNSSMAFVRELVGNDPVAVFRWAIVRAFFRAYFAFNDAGKRQRAFRGIKWIIL